MAVAGSLLIELGANVAKLQTDLETAKGSVKKFADDSKKIMSMMGITLGIGSLIAMTNNLAQAAAKQELEERRLASALKARGIVSQEVVDVLKEQAAEMQKHTIFGDEELMQAQRYALAMGALPSQLEAVLKISTQIALLHDRDLKSSIQTITRAMAGYTRSLREIDVNLLAVVGTAKTSDEILNKLETHFSANVQKDVESYIDKVKQFDNAWGDLKETLGMGVLPVMKSLMEMMTDLVQNFSKYIPGEFQIYGDLQVENDKKNVEEILKNADKQWKGTRGIIDKGDEKLALKKAEFLKKLYERTLRAEYEISTKSADEKYLYEIRKIDEEYTESLSKAKTFGIAREKIDDEFRKRYKIAYIADWNERVNIATEAAGRIYEASKKYYDEEEIRKQAARDRELQWLIYYGETSKQIKEEIRQAGLSDISALSPEIAKMIELTEQQGRGKDSTDPYTRRVELERESLSRIADLYDEHGKIKARYQDEWNAYIVAEEERKYNYMTKMGIGFLGATSQLFDSLYRMSDSKHKVLFDLMKAFAIAETIISTYSSAQKTFEVVLEQTENVYAAAAAAAVVTAAGLARVATIASTQPGGSSGGTSGAIGTMPVTSTEHAEPAPAFKPGGAINIYVYGSIVDHDAFARELVPSLMKAQKDNMH